MRMNSWPTDLDKTDVAKHCYGFAGLLLLVGVLANFVLLSPFLAFFASLLLVPVLAIVKMDLSQGHVHDGWIGALAIAAVIPAVLNKDFVWVDLSHTLIRTTTILATVWGLRAISSHLLNRYRCTTQETVLGDGDLLVIGVCALWLPLADWLLAILVSCLAASLMVFVQTCRYPQTFRTQVPYAAFLILTAYIVAVMRACGMLAVVGL